MTLFDCEKWHRERNERIQASRDAGHVHLDRIEPYVDTMRGQPIYCVHDPKEQGVVRSVSNSGRVVVHWKDPYSGEKNLATLREYGRLSVYESWLAPTDFEDYAVGTPPPASAVELEHEQDENEEESAESAAPGMAG